MVTFVLMSIVILSVIILSVVYAECGNFFHCAECRYAKSLSNVTFFVMLIFVYAGVNYFICYTKYQCLCIAKLSIIHFDGCNECRLCRKSHIKIDVQSVAFGLFVMVNRRYAECRIVFVLC
jgi:hypothetical protein